MSRSMKHYPFCKDRKSSKRGKQYCNRRIRRTMKKEDIPNGKIYKKFNESWDFISDYCFSETWNEYSKRGNNKEAIYYDWYRFYMGK